jgi:hypothetical protein
LNQRRKRKYSGAGYRGAKVSWDGGLGNKEGRGFSKNPNIFEDNNFVEGRVKTSKTFYLLIEAKVNTRSRSRF